MGDFEVIVLRLTTPRQDPKTLSPYRGRHYLNSILLITTCSFPSRSDHSNIIHQLLAMDMSYYWLFCICILLITASSDNDSDRAALLAIKSHIKSDPLGALSSWNDSLHHCEWQGVSCSLRHPGRVTVLDLQSRNLKGTLSPYLGNLSFLREITLSENNFHGEMPREIGRLFRLEQLSLNSNSFHGSFPGNLTHCSNLKAIDLRDNKLSGTISADISSLSKLEILYLARNEFTGYIPRSIGNLSSLARLSFVKNHLVGPIPRDFCRLQSLVFLQVGVNNLTGQLPSCIYHLNISFFGVASNQLEGTIPSNIGVTLRYIREIYFAGNKFTGLIPISLSNATRLETISFDQNQFTGSIPTDLGRLQNLTSVWFNANQLGTEGGDDMRFITSLTNCSNLESLDISENSLKGPLPDSISNITTSFRFLYAGSNQIYGSIPVGIINLVNLQLIELHANQLTGNIPALVGKLDKLVKVTLHENTLSGVIPGSIGNLTQLTFLQLGSNNFSGRIPSTLGNCQSLLMLDLSQNNFIGLIPKEVIGISSFTVGLYLHKNLLTGSLPSEVGNLTKIVELVVSENKLSNHIPATLGNCLSLEYLSMDGNFFQGEIPNSLRALAGLKYLDLSRNNLSGEIPNYLEQLPLQYLNLSFNQLEGNVPVKGVFGNTSLVSIVGNKKVCGGIVALQLPSCIQKSKKTSFSAKVFVPVIVGSLCLIAVLCFSLIYYRRVVSKINPSSTAVNETYKRVSYAELLRATNGFSSENLIGTGSYGSVFKGTLEEIHHSVAVKVLNLHREGASKSFLTECNALKNIRHRNLLKIITSCSGTDFQGDDFKALVFEFMPNGSLEEWLHPNEQKLDSRYLNFVQRMNIAMDVASALEYLHHNCHPGVVHCDLKPSNVLLDDDMTAHVADFGIAKIFADPSHDSAQSLASSVAVKGSIGYVAPEYGMGGEVSTRGDVYSYGILLLEMFTSKKPTNDMFQNGLSLHSYSKIALQNQVMEIVDTTMFPNETEGVHNTEFSTKTQECLVSVIQLGVACSGESPVERMTVKEVLTELYRIRDIIKVTGATEIIGSQDEP
ncbi:non-specific serine/threonine protein kinase [Ranunculus cassubicifolius]